MKGIACLTVCLAYLFSTYAFAEESRENKYQVLVSGPIPKVAGMVGQDMDPVDFNTVFSDRDDPHVIIGGNLPKGLFWQHGILVGTPVEAGKFSVLVLAEDGHPAHQAKALVKIDISKAGESIAPGLEENRTTIPSARNAYETLRDNRQSNPTPPESKGGAVVNNPVKPNRETTPHTEISDNEVKAGIALLLATLGKGFDWKKMDNDTRTRAAIMLTMRLYGKEVLRSDLELAVQATRMKMCIDYAVASQDVETLTVEMIAKACIFTLKNR